MPFAALGLSKPLLQAIADKGYDTPSPIQEAAIPAVLEGKDVMAAAQTGTGKTAGFTLPILDRLNNSKAAITKQEQNQKSTRGRNKGHGNQVRALILTPTRELAAQVNESVSAYGKHMSLKSTVVFGGVNINPQLMKLRGGADIVVATPGRLLDLYQQNAIRFDQLEILVLDEADRMLDMGFIHDIRRIIKLMPKQRQTLLFSATFSESIRQLAQGIVHHPVEISVAAPNATAAKVSQTLYSVDQKRKPLLLLHLIREHQWQQVLVFTRTKRGADRLARELSANKISAAAIHGNKSQGARTKALADFKRGATRILVATDIAARGLDIDQLPQVVNFDLPNVPEDYVHRIGRTGRAGAEGHAVSLVSADEFPQLVDIERVLKKLIPRENIAGFVAQNPLPESKLGQRTPKKAKPTANRSNSRPSRKPSSSRSSSRSDASNSKPTSKRRSANKSNDELTAAKKRPIKSASQSTENDNQAEKGNRATKKSSHSNVNGNKIQGNANPWSNSKLMNKTSRPAR